SGPVGLRDRYGGGVSVGEGLRGCTAGVIQAPVAVFLDNVRYSKAGFHAFRVLGCVLVVLGLVLDAMLGVRRRDEDSWADVSDITVDITSIAPEFAAVRE